MKLKLLAPIFKIIGFAIILLPVLILATAKVFNIIVITDKVLIRQIAGSLVFTGFLLIILSREKMEDEFADFCRLTAFRLTFLIGLISIILNPFFNNKNLNSSFHLLLIQCIFYIIIFYATKKGLIRYEK